MCKYVEKSVQIVSDDKVVALADDFEQIGFDGVFRSWNFEINNLFNDFSFYFI